MMVARTARSGTCALIIILNPLPLVCIAGAAAWVLTAASAAAAAALTVVKTVAAVLV